MRPLPRRRALVPPLLAAALLTIAPGIARAGSLWTLPTPGGGFLTAVAAAPDGAFVVLARAGDASTAVVRVSRSGATRRLALVPRRCEQVAVPSGGSPVLGCGARLVRVRPDGTRADLTVRWPAAVNDVSGIAVVPGGLLVAADVRDRGAQVLRVGPDGSAAVLAGGGTRGESSAGVPAAEVELGEITSLAADRAGTGVVFVQETEDEHLVRRVGRDGVLRTVAGGGSRTALRDGLSARSVEIDRFGSNPPEVAVPAGGDVLLTAGFREGRRLVQRVVRVDGDTGRLRLLAGPLDYFDGFNLEDGRSLGEARTLRPAALAAGVSGDVALVDEAGDREQQLRWIDAPRAPRLAAAIRATSMSPPAVTVRASHRARMTIAVRRGGRVVRRLTVRGTSARVALGALRTGSYDLRLTATDARGRRAADEVPLVVGRNPWDGYDCSRVSALRVDCLHPEMSLNDTQFGFVVVLRPDGQLWRADVDPRSRPGARVPAGTRWTWVR